MNTDRSIPASKRHSVIRAILKIFAGAILFLALIESISVTASWWRKGLPEAGAAEWFWMLLLPVLIVVYLRFFSVFRPDCRACQPDDRSAPGNLRGP